MNPLNPTPEQINAVRAKAGFAPLQAETKQPVQSLADKYGWNKASATPSFSERVGSDLKQRSEKMVTDVKQSITSPGSQLPGFDLPMQISGQAAGAVNDTIGEGIKSAGEGIKSLYSKLPEGFKTLISDQLAKIPKEAPDSPLRATRDAVIQKGIEAYEAVKQSNPDQVRHLEEMFNLASLYPGAKATEAVVPSVIKEGMENLGKVGVETAEKETAKLSESALKRITPDYASMTDAKRAALQNETILKDGVSHPRVTEGKNILGTEIKGERIIHNSDFEKTISEELANVPGYNPDLTHLETHNLIKSEIKNTAKEFRTSLGNEGNKAVIPKKQMVSVVRQAVEQVPESSLLLQKSDPVIKNYMRVVQNAVEKVKGTLEGSLDLRQIMDDTYENARGKLAFGSDKISALDEIHAAGRDALNKFLIDNAPNTEAKKFLEKQFKLYKADDVINAKAAAEAGSSAGRAVQKIKSSPVGRAVLKTGSAVIKGAATGVGIKL